MICVEMGSSIANENGTGEVPFPSLCAVYVSPFVVQVYALRTQLAFFQRETENSRRRLKAPI